jgi:uncharacterized membrane protein
VVEVAIEPLIARVLFWGGLLGVVVMLAGLLLWAHQGGLQGQVLEVRRVLRPGRSGHPADVFVSLSEVVGGLTTPPRDPLAMVALGVILLLITPVIGVAAAIPAFLRNGDRRYAAIAGIVLSMLLANLLFAGGVG